MIILHTRDAQDIFVESINLDPMGPVPPGSVRIAPPALTGTEVARWMGAGWEVLAERPIATPQPTAVPASVTRRQARQALLLAGLLDDVPAAIAAIPGETQRRMAEIEWADSLEFERNRPLVIQIGLALNLDDAGLDALFIEAGAL